MPSKKQAIPWPAKDHTVAKVAILRGFLDAWFPIFGQSVPNELLYVDGFAGPGHYSNHDEGSPVAAIRAAGIALQLPGWRATGVQCAFLEPDKSNFDYLSQHLRTIERSPRIRVDTINTTFEQGYARLRATFPRHLSGNLPLMLFLDPFGATGIPFELVRDVLAYDRTDVLINLDADGIGRNWSANYEHVLTNAFGDESWRRELNSKMDTRERCLRIVQHYRDQLRSIPGVRYTFPFEMLTAQRSVGTVGYFLIFACRHRKAMERMKYAMSKMDQLGTSQFSNARVGQLALFRFDQPGDIAMDVHRHFAGKGRISREAIWDFILNETPLYTQTPILRSLEERGMIAVDPSDPRRRRSFFPEDKVRWIEFLEED